MPSGGAVIGMWGEARRQEKMIRGAMVDLRKRAERRSQYYERIKLDPAQFLRVHGRKIRMKLDTVEAERAEGHCVMQPWQGDSSVTIDRFDARTFLDSVPEVVKRDSISDSSSSSDYDSTSDREDTTGAKLASVSERKVKQRCNYERYRTLVQNDYLGVEEGPCLRQIALEEEGGGTRGTSVVSKESQLTTGGGSTSDKIGKAGGPSNSATSKAAIGYNYEKNAGILLTKHSFSYDDSDASSDSDDSSFDEIDLEVTLDVDKIDSDQKRLLTTYSMAYGLKKNIFLRYLAKDKNEQESLRLSKMLEDEKAMYSGRKGRHKRREFHDEKVQLHRRMNPRMELSYVTRENRKEVEEKVKEKSVERQKSRSTSESSTEEDTAPKYITSFDINNEQDEECPHEELKIEVKSLKKSMTPERSKSRDKRRSRSRRRDRERRSRSRSDQKTRRRTPKSFRGSRSRSPRRNSPRRRSRHSRQRSRSRSYRSRHERRSRSRGRSRNRGARSRSRSRSKDRAEKRSKYSGSTKNKEKLSSILSKTRNRRSRSSSDSSLDKHQRPKLDLSAIQAKCSNSKTANNETASKNGSGVIKRYRRKSLSSNSDLEESPPRTNLAFSKPPLPPIRRPSELDQNFNGSNSSLDGSFNESKYKTKTAPTSSKGNESSSTKLSAVERMKKLMERQLNKQIKEDKQSRALKEERKFQQKMEWEEHQKHMSDRWSNSGKRRDLDKRSRSSSKDSAEPEWKRKEDTKKKSRSKSETSSDSD